MMGKTIMGEDWHWWESVLVVLLYLRILPKIVGRKLGIPPIPKWQGW